MIQCGPVRISQSITAAVAVLVIAGAAAAYGDGAARHPSISREEIEKLKAAQFNNRAQGSIFDDGYVVVCPQFTSLIHSVDQKLQFITPTYSLDGLGAYSRDGYQSNSKEIIFSNRDCRYIITIKKFTSVDGIERETPLFPHLTTEEWRKLLNVETQILGVPATRKEAPPVPSQSQSSGVVVQDNKIILDMNKIDPDRSGTNETSIYFSRSDNNIQFYGMIYFSPKWFRTNVVNVPKGFRLEYRRDEQNKAYELNYITPEARMQFSITKELLLDSSWTKVFAKVKAAD
jgi:hypothetical protein